MIYFFDTCRDLIRTLPALQHDETRAEDVDTEAEDHAPDECRYACMSRPYVRADQPKPKPEFWDTKPTMDALWKDHTRSRSGRI